MKRTKYLTNKDLLAEIHRSKVSFCSFVEDEYAQHDIILPSLDKVNRLTVAQAKRNRADRIGKAAYELAKEQKKKVKQAECLPDWKKLKKQN